MKHIMDWFLGTALPPPDKALSLQKLDEAQEKTGTFWKRKVIDAYVENAMLGGKGPSIGDLTTATNALQGVTRAATVSAAAAEDVSSYFDAFRRTLQSVQPKPEPARVIGDGYDGVLF